jgi:hypothetical protein
VGKSRGTPSRSAFASTKNRELFDAAIAAGWQCWVQGNGHVRCRNPITGNSFTLSTTLKGGENRAALNNRADARRAGLDVWLALEEERTH